MSQKEGTAQQELARAKKNLQAASQREKHALSHLQVLHQEAIEGLNRDHQTQLQQLKEQLTRQIAIKLAAGSKGKIRELEGERDRLSEQLAEVRRQEQDNMRGELEKVRDVECERDQLAEQLKSVEQERKKVRGKLAKKCREVQAVQEEMEKSLADAQERLLKEVEGSQTVKQQVEQQAIALLEQDQQIAELERKVQQLEQELTETNVALQEEQKQPQLATTPAIAADVPSASNGLKLKNLQTRCCQLESENQKLRTQLVSVILCIGVGRCSDLGGRHFF